MCVTAAIGVSVSNLSHAAVNVTVVKLAARRRLHHCSSFIAHSSRGTRLFLLFFWLKQKLFSVPVTYDKIIT